jgi:membrane protein insertase Oxa1/YidC/SpoIIIJ
MDPKGKGMVVNDKEKESIFNEPRDDKPTDSGSSHKKKDGKKKKRRIKKIVYYDSDESSSSPRDDDYDEKKKPVNSNFSFDYLVFLIIPTPICFLFLLVNLHTLMERTTLFGVTKCVVTFSLSILIFGR